MYVARPLLAFKRDLSRPTSETRTTHDPENISETQNPRRESPPLSSLSSPLEPLDTDTTSSFRSILDKVKNTLSPSTKRRTSETQTKPSSDQTSTNPSVNSLSKKNSQKTPLNRNKSVSFADNVGDDEHDDDSFCRYSLDERNQIVENAQTLANQILIAGINEATMNNETPKSTVSTYVNSDDEFQRDCYQTIKPRRISQENKEQLVYQDLSAEIVAYVLKHAIRTIKKEEEEEAEQQKQQQLKSYKTNEDNEDFIDLK